MLPSRSATCSARAQAALRRRARPAARPRRTACGRRSPAYVAPTASAEAGQLDVAAGARRAADRTAAAAASRRRRRRRPRRRADRGEHGDARRRRGVTAAATARHASTQHRDGAVGPGDDGVVAGVDAERLGAVGIASNSWIWRRSGTTSSCIVTTTDVGTSISPSQSSERNDPIARPASSTIRQSCADGLLDRPRRPRAGLALRGTAGRSASAAPAPASAGRARPGR